MRCLFCRCNADKSLRGFRLLDFIRSNTTTPFKIYLVQIGVVFCVMSLRRVAPYTCWQWFLGSWPTFGRCMGSRRQRIAERRENGSNDHLKRHKIASSTLSLRSISWSLPALKIQKSSHHAYSGHDMHT